MRSASFVAGCVLAVLGTGLLCYPGTFLFPSFFGIMLVFGVVLSAPVFVSSAALLWFGEATLVTALFALVPAAVLILQMGFGVWHISSALICKTYFANCVTVGGWSLYLLLSAAGLLVLMGVRVGREANA